MAEKKPCAACGGEMEDNVCTVCGWVDHSATKEAPAPAKKKVAKKKASDS